VLPPAQRGCVPQNGPRHPPRRSLADGVAPYERTVERSSGPQPSFDASCVGCNAYRTNAPARPLSRPFVHATQTGAADLRRDLHPGSAHASLIADEASRPGTRSREPDGWTARLSRRHVPGTRRPSPPSLAGSLIGCSSSRIGSCVTSGAPRTGRLDPDPGWGLDRCMGRRAPHAWLLRRLADPTGGHQHRRTRRQGPGMRRTRSTRPSSPAGGSISSR
jgi:hypothetical protein